VIQAYIDRIEEDKAVLLLGDDMDKTVLPAKYLPNGVNEGEYVTITIVPDPEATEAAEDEALSLLRDE